MPLKGTSSAFSGRGFIKAYPRPVVTANGAPVATSIKDTYGVGNFQYQLNFTAQTYGAPIIDVYVEATTSTTTTSTGVASAYHANTSGYSMYNESMPANSGWFSVQPGSSDLSSYVLTNQRGGLDSANDGSPWRAWPIGDTVTFRVYIKTIGGWSAPSSYSTVTPNPTNVVNMGALYSDSTYYYRLIDATTNVTTYGYILAGQSGFTGDVLVVGGGGGGGGSYYYGGGGGGAGGVTYFSFTMSRFDAGNQPYAPAYVTAYVGAGGSGTSHTYSGSSASGNQSLFQLSTPAGNTGYAIGGGGGNGSASFGSGQNGSAAQPGSGYGGSGGGAPGGYGGTGSATANAWLKSGTQSFGDVFSMSSYQNNGSGASNSSYWYGSGYAYVYTGGGGGGAGAAAANVNGGSGISTYSGITSTPLGVTAVGGGGGGSSWTYFDYGAYVYGGGGTGGSGGGAGAGNNGAAATGGGGGAARSFGLNGGRGSVVLRYAKTQVSATQV